MAAFGYEEPEARRLLICGGGNIALLLAQEIEAEHTGISIKIIEANAERAATVAQHAERHRSSCTATCSIRRSSKRRASPRPIPSSP